MPFTAILVGAALCAFMLMLACAALGLQVHALGIVTATALALAVPVFFLEALGFLGAAARFFFGRRQ